MLSRRIIPCLDVKEGRVVKGIQFRAHQDMGTIEEYAQFYCDTSADELVFYDITASSEERSVDRSWVTKVSCLLDIPFCVAGGIRTLEDARMIFKAGADKISINSPALERPSFIKELSEEFGRQSIVVGIDSLEKLGTYEVYQYTGCPDKTQYTGRQTEEWVSEVVALGAGEVVLNCMNRDGMRGGYDIVQLQKIRETTPVPLIASGGAGCREDFLAVFREAKVDGVLAASVFHEKHILINELKQFLASNQIVSRR
jgi:cyclase